MAGPISQSKLWYRQYPWLSNSFPWYLGYLWWLHLKTTLGSRKKKINNWSKWLSLLHTGYNPEWNSRKQTLCVLHKRGGRSNCCPSTKTWTRWLSSIAVIIVITTASSSISAPVSVVIAISISVTISVPVPVAISVTVPVTVPVTISITISLTVTVSVPMESKNDYYEFVHVQAGSLGKSESVRQTFA